MYFKNVLKTLLFVSIFLFAGSNVFGATDYALRFDGVDDYVNCGNDSSLNPTSAITVEALIKLDSHNPENWSNIIQRGNYDPYSLYVYDEVGYSNSAWFDVYVVPDELREAGANNLIRTGNWYHIVGTYNGTTTILYINGIEKSSVADIFGIIATSSDDVIIGAVVKIPPYYAFDGLIDNVKIYNRALTPTEVENTYNGFEITNGLVGSWNFNEGEGSTAYDNSGFGNNGTISGAVYEKKGNIIFVPPSTISNMLAFAGDLFTDLNLVIILTIGLPVSFWVIKKVITLV